MTSPRAVTYHAKDGVASITLNRPAVLNALNTELAADLADSAEVAAADPAVVLVIVRGADCMRSWETEEANRAWQDKREALYYPRPGAGQQHGQ